MMDTDGRGEAYRPEIPNNAGWATFEARVRGRRFARCIDRANAALDAGEIDEARSAVEEARALAPDAPEISELEARIAAPPTPRMEFVSPAILQQEPDPGWARVMGAMAVLLVLFGLFGFGLTQLYFTRPAQELLSTGLSKSPPDSPDSLDVAVPAGGDSQVPSKSAGTEEKAATATEERAAITTLVEPGTPAGDAAAPSVEPQGAPASRLPTSPPLPSTPPSATTNDVAKLRPSSERPRTTTPSAVGTTARASSTPESPPTDPAALPDRRGDSAAGGEPRTIPEAPAETRMTPAPLASPPAPAVAAPPVPAVETSSAPVAALDTPIPASRGTLGSDLRADESARIRNVLLRYETAYNRLDASAASSVWPGVDQAALDRAFKGLLSQRVSLGLCDITVIGDIGGASCAGKARWEPKIGGGLQTADRYWTFNLRRTGDGWRIEQIRVR
jgi:hypothetical protein